MAEIFHIHPDNPQERLLQQVAEVLRGGGVIAYPTDSAYALGCHLNDKKALDRLRQLRGIDDKRFLTLMCRDLSELATYAVVDNSVFRLLKQYTPGPFTFILKATKETPKSFQNPRRKALGLRVPDNAIAQALLAEHDAPIASASLILPGESEPLFDAESIEERLGSQLDVIVDGGFCDIEPTTVLDCLGDEPVMLRQGRGVL